MPFTHWLTFRQAREALRTGQPDEARRLLAPFAAEGYRKAIKLTGEVARAYLARGNRCLRADDAEGAWRELLAAESLNTGEEEAVRLRHTLTRLGLAECRAALEAGHPMHVIETAARMRSRNARGPEFDVLVEAAESWVLASEQADRGDFLLAKDTLTRSRKKLDDLVGTGIDRFTASLDERHERFRAAVAKLDDAADARHWRDAVQWADEAIAAAPDHREARSLRAKAWAAVYPETPAYVEPAASDVVPLVPVPSVRAPAATRVTAVKARAVTTVGYAADTPRPDSQPEAAPKPASSPMPKRFLLWVDGVGGYLVCLAPRVTLGQAISDGPVDVPLFAELSRLHAELTRDEEGYVLESGRDVQVNGAAAKRAVLKPGDRLTLGSSCQMVFHQPVPISPSARLELVSGHRLPMAVDGVLLMAESLVLGPGQRVHVRLPAVPDHPGNVVIYRSKDGLGVRFDGKYTVDGRPCQGAATLALPSVVVSDLFTFALEPVGLRL